MKNYLVVFDGTSNIVLNKEYDSIEEDHVILGGFDDEDEAFDFAEIENEKLWRNI